MTTLRQQVAERAPDRSSERGPRGDGIRKWLWLAPAVIVIVLVHIFPIVYGAWLSLYDKRIYQKSGTFAGLDNYVEQLGEPDLWHSAFIGTLFAGGSIAVQLLLGLITALVLHQQFRGRSAARSAALLPYMMPTVACALIFGLMFNDLYGIVNQVLVKIGIIDEPILFLGDEHWALPVSIAVGAWKWTPLVVIMILARLQSIDDSLYESARVEGAGAVRQFFDITLPSLRAVILLVVLLRAIWMFNAFDIPYLLTQGGPLDATQVMSIYAYEVTFLNSAQGAGAALAVLMCLLLVVLAIPYFLLFRPEREVAVE